MHCDAVDEAPLAGASRSRQLYDFMALITHPAGPGISGFLERGEIVCRRAITFLTAEDHASTLMEETVLILHHLTVAQPTSRKFLY